MTTCRTLLTSARNSRNPVDSSLLAGLPEGSVTYVPTLDGLLSTSDVVSLNLPLNASTKGFFGKQQFNTMKKGSVLINTARGGVVDEQALLDALESGQVSVETVSSTSRRRELISTLYPQLSSAGLDVYPDEPTINPLLLANDKLTLLPHMGTETEEAQKKQEVLVLKNLDSALSTGQLVTPVWEQKGKL